MTDIAAKIIKITLLIRKRDKTLIGHAPITLQLDWCKKERIPRAIFTHCGTEIVTGDHADIAAKIKQLGKERGISVRMAYDGMEVTV